MEIAKFRRIGWHRGTVHRCLHHALLFITQARNNHQRGPVKCLQCRIMLHYETQNTHSLQDDTKYLEIFLLGMIICVKMAAQQFQLTEMTILTLWRMDFGFFFFFFFDSSRQHLGYPQKKAKCYVTFDKVIFWSIVKKK